MASAKSLEDHLKENNHKYTIGRCKTKRGGKGKKKIQKKKEGCLTIGHVNIRGIKSKIKDITSLTEEIKLDIMIFSETKLDGKQLD